MRRPRAKGTETQGTENKKIGDGAASKRGEALVSTTYGLHRALLLNRDRTAFWFGDRHRSWAEVADRVARLAGALKHLGVGKGDRVAVLMLNQDRYLELYLGTAWTGAVIVPLNVRWSAIENEDALRDCRPQILITDSTFASMSGELAGKLGIIRLVYADDFAGNSPASALDYEEMIGSASPVPDAEARDGDLAGIFYTAGTTGRSKGVMLSHRNLMANSRNMLADQLTDEDAVYLHAAPMFHLANSAEMYLNFLAGSGNAIVRAFTADGVAQAIERYKVTHTLLVPTMVQMLVDHPSVDQYDLSSLRSILYGASPMNEAVLERAMKKLPEVEFTQAYGMTELSPCATVLPWQDHLGEARKKGRHRSAGRPAFMVDVRVVDAYDRPVPPRTVGEIVARGENVMLGYWERPEETAKAVVDGWMHTGDGGYMDGDGYVYVVDRIKDMIISGGENVYSAEVENCVAQHPAVAQCAVIGIPSDQWGEAVHAIVVRKTGVAVAADDIIAFCRERIAAYKCPRSVDIRDDTSPLSGAGKILKRELRALFWDGKTRAVN
jgi:long-chain acyl-CoA synthetase